RRERPGLLDRDLSALAQLEQGEEGNRLLDPGKPDDLSLEVEPASAPKHGAETRQELADGRKPQRHVPERERGRLGDQHPQRSRKLLRLLRRELALDLRGERRRAEAEEARSLG